MSPILIAILAVFCCIVGFVMGRMTAMSSKQSSVAGFDPRLIRLVESALVTDFNHRRKAWANNCDPKGFEK